MHNYIYIYVYVYVYVCMYIYIYIYMYKSINNSSAEGPSRIAEVPRRGLK